MSPASATLKDAAGETVEVDPEVKKTRMTVTTINGGRGVDA